MRKIERNIFVLILLFIAMTGNSQQSKEIKKFQLTEYLCVDSLFEKKMLGLVLSDPDCFKSREEYIYNFFVEFNENSNLYEFTLILEPISKSQKNSIGFWQIGNKSCFLASTIPKVFFAKFFRKKSAKRYFSYKEKIAIDSYGGRVTNKPEQFSIWRFTYKDDLEITEIICVP